MDILCEVRNRIAYITLNRPAALNSLSLAMVNALREQLPVYSRDPQVLAVCLRGSGEKAFCAGGDIRALYEDYRDSGRINLEFFEREYPLDYLLHVFPKPCIALLDGIVMGGGMGISQGARWRLVGDRTRMAMPEVGIGFFPDVGGSYFLSRLPGRLGVYLALTGNPLRAADALYAGLADRYLPPAAVARLPAALDAIEWNCSADPGDDIDTVLRGLAGDAGSAPLATVRAAIDLHFAPTEVGDIMRSLESETRPEHLAWAQQTLKTLRSRSPTMLKVALQQLARGAGMSFADCLRMELGMVAQCYRQGDFFEGVRALVIDKDNAPHWQPAQLDQVTAAQVEVIFTNPWEGRAHPLAHIEGVLESCN